MAKQNVWRVATAPVHTAYGTPVAAGAEIPYGTTPWEDFTEWPIQLSSDSISVAKKLEKLIVQGPRDLAPELIVILQDFIETVTLGNYEQTVESFSLATNATDATGVVVESGTSVNLCVIVEMIGIGFFYLPNSFIEWTSTEGSTVETGNQPITITPLTSSSLDSTSNWDWVASDGA